jgi:hypothetical protein
VFDIVTSRASPAAASQAAKTKMMMGNINDRVMLKFRVIRVVVIKIDSIIPSRHRSEDIKCDR